MCRKLLPDFRKQRIKCQGSEEEEGRVHRRRRKELSAAGS